MKNKEIAYVGVCRCYNKIGMKCKGNLIPLYQKCEFCGDYIKMVRKENG